MNFNQELGLKIKKLRLNEKMCIRDRACDDYRSELHELKEMGFLGIKLHPDYQDMYFNDIRYKRILDYASELGLIVVVHAGKDPKCPDHVHCAPEMIEEVLNEVAPEKLVLAHFGGNEMCIRDRLLYELFV